jgi:hypothetical protein
MCDMYPLDGAHLIFDFYGHILNLDLLSVVIMLAVQSMTADLQQKLYCESEFKSSENIKGQEKIVNKKKQ